MRMQKKGRRFVGKVDGGSGIDSGRVYNGGIYAGKTLKMVQCWWTGHLTGGLGAARNATPEVIIGKEFKLRVGK